MADVKNRNIYRGSSKVFDPLNPRRSSAIEMLNVDNVDGDLDSALTAALMEVGMETKVGRHRVPLHSITANWVDNTKALCVAKFGFKGAKQTGGFKEGISLKTGYGSARWIQKPYDDLGDPSYKGNAKKDDSETVVGLGGVGSPSGVIEVDKNRVPKQYTWRMPIWIITVAVVTAENPASTIGHYIAHINSDHLLWDGFHIPRKTLRFDGANIDYLKNGYGVTYQFSHRRDGWVEQWPKLNKTDTSEGGKKGTPIRGSEPGNILMAPMLPSLSFAYQSGSGSPGFPDS